MPLLSRLQYPGRKEYGETIHLGESRHTMVMKNLGLFFATFSCLFLPGDHDHFGLPRCCYSGESGSTGRGSLDCTGFIWLLVLLVLGFAFGFVPVHEGALPTYAADCIAVLWGR